MAKYPQFVWALDPNRAGRVFPQVWYQEAHTSNHGKDGKLEVVPTAARHDMLPGDVAFGFDLLIRLYPPPEGFTYEPLKTRIIEDRDAPL